MSASHPWETPRYGDARALPEPHAQRARLAARTRHSCRSSAAHSCTAVARSCACPHCRTHRAAPHGQGTLPPDSGDDVVPTRGAPVSAVMARDRVPASVCGILRDPAPRARSSVPHLVQHAHALAFVRVEILAVPIGVLHRQAGPLARVEINHTRDRTLSGAFEGDDHIPDLRAHESRSQRVPLVAVSPHTVQVPAAARVLASVSGSASIMRTAFASFMILSLSRLAGSTYPSNYARACLVHHCTDFCAGARAPASRKNGTKVSTKQG